MDLSQDILKFKRICFDHNRANVFTSESILLYEVSGCLADLQLITMLKVIVQKIKVW